MRPVKPLSNRSKLLALEFHSQISYSITLATARAVGAGTGVGVPLAVGPGFSADSIMIAPIVASSIPSGVKRVTIPSTSWGSTTTLTAETKRQQQQL